ncbi:hypothetical protein Poli38472_007051 [Pythium oligandrum]|uniref:Armadillo repeat-containing protein 7 n=1 Tax=Pythium oligandrum TaxID=41045 RepID=A0A8K1FE01_PYTOL|nr:hypothetical protein Poli38472_007051 [Pythium oligandrum]|eukprot:TMW58906.1 hypothetical protein Poli38472_007051 [Pythium oligandrum]
MLSTPARLAQRQGKYGTPRHEYLQQLVRDYARTPHHLRREEIVAQLANFAYDPINYAAFRELHVMELFGDLINTTTTDATQKESESESKTRRLLVEFAMGGICNCVCDPALQRSFLALDGASQVLSYVMKLTLEDFTSEKTEDSVAFNTTLSALTICFFLLDSEAFVELTEDHVVTQLTTLLQHSNTQIANIAAAFLTRSQELIASVHAY